MRYIDLTYNSDARTLTVSDSLAGTTVDDLSTSFRLDSATLSKDADIDIVYGVLLRSKARTSVGYSFSRFDKGENTVPIPQDVLKACKGGSLPIYLRITYDADGSIETSLPLTLRVANLPDPVEAVHASGDLVMLRMSSWDWRQGLTYAKGAVVVYEQTLYMSLKDTNRGNTPEEGSEYWGTVSTSSGLPPGIAPYLEGLSENVQEALDNIRESGDSLSGRVDDVEDLAETVSDDLEKTDAEVEGLKISLNGKQNLITIGEPESPKVGDIWIIEGGPIDPTVIEYASVKDLQNTRDVIGTELKAETRNRIEGDDLVRSETVVKIAQALDEAKDYAQRVGAAAYHYKGSVSNTDLTMVRDPAVGDLYNITDSGRFPAGSNVVWDGNDWDKLSETIDLSRYDNHILDQTNPHNTHYSQIGFSEEQMSAINSGISEQKVSEINEAVQSVETMISFGPSAPPSAKLWIHYE